MAVVTKMLKRPACEGCSHPISFHGVDFDRCQALGCKCAGYTGDTYLAVNTLDVAQVAERLGTTEQWVTEHKKDLGVVMVPHKDLRVWRHGNGKVGRTAGSAPRFYPEAVTRYMADQGVADSKDA